MLFQRRILGRALWGAVPAGVEQVQGEQRLVLDQTVFAGGAECVEGVRTELRQL